MPQDTPWASRHWGVQAHQFRSCSKLSCLKSHLKSNQLYFIDHHRDDIFCVFSSVLVASHPHFLGSNNPGIVVSPNMRTSSKKQSPFFVQLLCVVDPFFPMFTIFSTIFGFQSFVLTHSSESSPMFPRFVVQSSLLTYSSQLPLCFHHLPFGSQTSMFRGMSN